MNQHQASCPNYHQLPEFTRPRPLSQDANCLLDPLYTPALLPSIPPVERFNERQLFTGGHGHGKSLLQLIPSREIPLISFQNGLRV